MKAFILKEEDFENLLAQLELHRLRQNNMLNREDSQVLDDLHRAFWYVVVRWVQKNGGAGITRG